MFYPQHDVLNGMDNLVQKTTVSKSFFNS